MDGGNGSAVPAEDGTVEVTLDIGALSALAVGGTTTGLLRNAGRVSGEDEAVARLGGLLQAPTPFITDEF